jgi:hypothetical protein
MRKKGTEGERKRNILIKEVRIIKLKKEKKK